MKKIIIILCIFSCSCITPEKTTYKNANTNIIINNDTKKLRNDIIQSITEFSSDADSLYFPTIQFYILEDSIIAILPFLDKSGLDG